MSRTVTVILSLVFLFFVLSPVTADPTVDPNHRIYDSIEEWQIAGLVEDVPAFRPYPAHILTDILGGVEARGGQREKELAAEYQQLFADQYNFDLWATGRNFSRDDDVQPKGGLGFSSNGNLTDTLAYGASFGAFAIERGAEDLLPKGERSEDDVLEDNAKVRVAGRDIYTLLQIKTQTTFEFDNLYIQAGLLRRSYGPFHNESPVVSEDAPQTGNFVLEWRRPRFRYTTALFSMTATQLFEQRESTLLTENRQVDLNGDGIADYRYDPFYVPGKHLYMHSFQFDVAPWLDLGIFETILFGPRLEPAYFVPLKFLWHAQGVANFYDNSLIGITADVRPARGWRVPFTLYVDDASFNDLAQFNFDTKYKLTLATAVQWSPPTPVVRKLALSYEAVMPYMYTHSVTNPYALEPNYLNYLHQGENLGTGLPPNSDRLALEATFAPASRISFGLRGAMIRHGNASEGVIEQFVNDGSYNDPGKDGEFVVFDDEDGDGVSESNEVATWVPGELTYNDGTRFLTQDHIEITYQAGGSVTLRPVTGPLSWDVTVGYTYEYIDGILAYEWDSSSGGRTVSLGDETNHYAEVLVKVAY
ncbi:MAG: hypothetical protein ACOCWS_00375 [Alkalispirochaetaceae bacterium]